MIIINDEFHLEPDGYGTYNIVQFKWSTAPTTNEKSKGIEKSKNRKIKTIMSYSVSIKRAIERISNELAQRDATVKDIDIKDYIKLLKTYSKELESYG